MIIKTLTTSTIITALSLLTFPAFSADFGVKLEWDNKMKQEVMKNAPSNSPYLLAWLNQVKLKRSI